MCLGVNYMSLCVRVLFVEFLEVFIVRLNPSIFLLKGNCIREGGGNRGKRAPKRESQNRPIYKRRKEKKTRGNINYQTSNSRGADK